MSPVPIIGLTGGIASGKSAVADILEGLCSRSKTAAVASAVVLLLRLLRWPAGRDRKPRRTCRTRSIGVRMSCA